MMFINQFGILKEVTQKNNQKLHLNKQRHKFYIVTP